MNIFLAGYWVEFEKPIENVNTVRILNMILMTVLVGVISVNFVIVLDYLEISVMFNSNEESKIKN